MNPPHPHPTDKHLEPLDVNSEWKQHVVLMEPLGTKIKHQTNPSEQSVRSSLEKYGTMFVYFLPLLPAQTEQSYISVDVQFRTFKAGWSAIFVTFEDPYSVSQVLRTHLPLVRLGEEKLRYTARLMDPNRIVQYKPPFPYNNLQVSPGKAPRQQSEPVPLNGLLPSLGSTPASGSTPLAPKRWAMSVDTMPSSSTATPKRIEPPTAPRAMHRAQPKPLLPRGMPSAPFLADPLTRGVTTPDKSNGPQKTVPVPPPPPRITPTDQIGLLLAETDLLSRMITEAESLRDAKRSHIAQQTQDRIKSLESQAADERSKRKSLERVEHDLLRELNEIESAYRREVELAKRARDELKNISQHRRIATQGKNQDNSTISPHSVKISQVQEEVDALTAYLADLDSKITSEEGVISKLRREIDSASRASTILPESQNSEQELVSIPSFNGFLAALDFISKRVVADIGNAGEQYNSAVESSGAPRTPVRVLKRHNDTLE